MRKSAQPTSILRTFYKTFVFVGLFVVLSSIGLSTFATARINNRLLASYNREQTDDATQTATFLKSEIDSVKDKLLYVSQIEAIKSLDPKVCNPEIESIISQFQAELGNIGRIGPDGVFYCSGNKQIIGKQGSSFGSYVTDIFNDPEHKPVISRMVRPTGSDSYLLAVHVPVYDKKGAFIGTLGGAISINKLATNYLNDVRIGKTGFVSVVDDNGDIIYTHDQQNIGKNRYSDAIQSQNGHNAALNAAFETAKKGGMPPPTRYSTNGQERMVVMTNEEILPGRRFVVYGVIPMSEVRTSAQELGLSNILRRLTLGYGLAVIIASFVLLRFMRRRVFHPISTLDTLAQKVQSGDMRARVHIHQKDELGRLGESFNEMLGQIQEYHRELENQVKLKTEQLRDALKQSEGRNVSLEQTKRAMLNVMSDLAEEKDKLQTETARIEAMFNSMGDALIVTDQYSKIVQVNPVAEKLLGISAKDLTGQWYPDVIYLYDQDGNVLPPEKRPISIAITSGKAIRSRDFSIGIKTTKTKTPISLTLSPLILNKQPLGVVQIFSDITVERELDQAKDDFVSLVSHQLRTPATAVKQFLGMIREGYAGKVTAEQADFINTAYESNERQIGIIDDLLNVSRLDLGKLKPNLKPEDITALVKDICQIMQPKAAERKQKLIVNAPTSYTVPIDVNILRMAIENFVDNASKYTPDGGSVTVSVEKHGKSIHISVADTGVGIAERDIKKLYKKFSRIENSLSVVRGGSGLGLYIAHQIIELHNGKLTVSSKVGKGTTFTIQLKQE